MRDDIDNLWMKTSDFNREPCTCYNANRHAGMGGGLLLNVIQSLM